MAASMDEIGNRADENRQMAFLKNAITIAPGQFDNFLGGSIDPAEVHYGVSINGMSFETMLYNEELRRLLVVLLFFAKTVVASRMSPMQKAQLV
jgi:hypothetical protein